MDCTNLTEALLNNATECVAYNVSKTVAVGLTQGADLSKDADGGFARLLAIIIDKMSEGVLSLWTSPDGGTLQALVLTLALFGLISLIVAAGQRMFRFFWLLFQIFIAVPLIVILGLVNRHKRKQRWKELGEVRKNFVSKEKVPWYAWILWISTRILLPAILIALLIWGYGLIERFLTHSFLVGAFGVLVRQHPYPQLKSRRISGGLNEPLI